MYYEMDCRLKFGLQVGMCCLQPVVQQTSIVQKFGNTRVTPSTLGGHEGKYTPSSSVPDLVQRYILFFNFPY
jgi:hypothetical protein